MDSIDERILAELQRNAKQTVAQIAKRVNAPITTVHHRIKRLETDGVIKTYRPVLDYRKIGQGIHALVLVTAEGKTDQERLARNLLRLAHVTRVAIVTGGFDLLLDARVASVEELNDLVVARLRTMPGVDKTQTMLVLREHERE